MSDAEQITAQWERERLAWVKLEIDRYANYSIEQLTEAINSHRMQLAACPSGYTVRGNRTHEMRYIITTLSVLQSLYEMKAPPPCFIQKEPHES